MSAEPLDILVAEDDAGVRQLLREQLAADGYRVTLARGGADALAILQMWRPAGLILDLNMPGVDGFAVLEGLRKLATAPPVLVLSGRFAAEDVRRAVMLGAKDYVRKPFTEALMRARVARLVRVRTTPPLPHPGPGAGDFGPEPDEVLI